MALLGGFTITSATRLSSLAVRVNFTSTYGATYFYQLYAGRRLVGVSGTKSARFVDGFVKESTYPQHLQLVAVTLAEKETDFGSLLPPRPYNVARFTLTPSGWTDAKFIDITAGTEPGGAVSSSNRIARILYDEERDYTFESEPLEHGTWNFEATGIDDKPDDGNAGTALELQTTLKSYPPDVTQNPSRLSVDIDAGEAAVTFGV